MAPQAATADPYAAIATPVAPASTSASDTSDPYAGIATPIPDENTPSLGSKVWEGAKESMPGQAAAAVLTPPKDHKEELAMQFGGGPALAAYRAAAGIVGGLESAIKAPSAEYQQAKQDFLRGVHDATTKDYRDLASDSASLASDTMTAGGNPLGSRFRELSEGARPGGNLATPVTKDVIDAATMALGAKEADTAAAGKPLFPNPFRKLTGSDIQPTIKAGIQDVWNQTADSAGVPRPTTASVQDMGQEVGDAILARSKAAYKLIDGATDGRFSGTEQALKTVNQDLRSVTNDIQEQELLTRKTRLEMQMYQMMDDAEAKGVPKSTVDAAKADFKKAQAIYDTNHQIRMSTTGVRPGMQGAADAPEEVNAKSLLNRTNKLYNSGRLQQAVGDDGSEDLIGHSAKALKMTKNVARNRKVAGTVAGAIGAGEAYRHLAP